MTPTLTIQNTGQTVCGVITTGWPRHIGCLIFTGRFPQKSPRFNESFAENDVQLKAFSGSWPWCTVFVYVSGARIASLSLCFSPTQQHTATHCNTRQHTATFCNKPQRYVPHLHNVDFSRRHVRYVKKMQHTATHCNTLQRTATHCNTVGCYVSHMESRKFDAVCLNCCLLHACCRWSIICPASDLNRGSSSLGLFCHVPLNRDQ